MKILKQDQIDLVTKWLNNDFSWDDDSYFHDTSSPVAGAQFQFEGVSIVNPFFDENGTYLGEYEEACNYYGVDLVNQYFLTLANNLENRSRETFLESVLDSYNSGVISDDIIYEDDKIKVISTDIESSLLSKLDQAFPDDNINNIIRIGDPVILIGFKSFTDGEDFIFENDKVIAIWPSEGFDTTVLTNEEYSHFSLDNLDELYQTIQEGKILPKNLWPILFNKLIEIPYLASCLDSSRKYGNGQIPWSYFGKYLFVNNFGIDFCEILDGSILSNHDFTSSFNEFFLLSEVSDFIDIIDNTSWDVLTEKFKLSKDDIINELKNMNTSPVIDDISSLILQSVSQATMEHFYKEYLRIIHDEIKKALPTDILNYTTFDSNGITITKCPVDILRKIMLDYFNLNIHVSYVQNIVNCDLSCLIDRYISDYFDPNKVSRLLENVNPDIDIEEFNSCIQNYA